MNDDILIAAEIDAAESEGREINNACARMIASQYADDVIGAEFATTGAISGDVYYSLFYLRGRHMWDSVTQAEQRKMSALHQYLQAVRHDPRAARSARDECYLRRAVPGWSSLWLR